MSLLASGQFGNTNNPFCTGGLGSSTLCAAGDQGQGLILILSNLIRFVIVVGGIYTLWNIIMAGYGFLSAGGEPKNIAKAWEKIWQSLIGLLIIAGSFVLAVVFGYLIFGLDNALILIQPRVFTP